MAANDLTFEQLSTVLSDISAQATGTAQAAPVNYSQFVTLAQTTLKVGTDPLMNVISQVLGRTIFSIRPYSAKFASMYVTNQQFGNHQRKLTSIDKPFENDDRFLLTDGSAIDQQVVNKPSVLQTNFYGANVVQKSLTIFKDQLDCAFSSPEEFGRFISMIMQNVSDMLEQAAENRRRATVSNLIIATVKHGSTEQTVHLFSEWKTARGSQATAWTALSAAELEDLFKFSYARIQTVAKLMGERSAMYHMNVSGATVMRHTTARNMRAFFATSVNEQVKTGVLSSVFNDQYMKNVAAEEVNFWGSIKSPLKLQGKSNYLKPDGTIGADSSNQTVDNIFGIIMDEEAAGVTHVNEWSAAAPFNARGGYTNIFWHRTEQYWNDQTENAVVFLLD